MFSGIVTLMARSLRLEARQFRTHLFRLTFVVFIYFAMMIAQAQSATKGAPGLDFFKSIVWLNCLFITLGGVSFFSSAVSEEKEENTLGLLQMTGLNPIGILLGKSTARVFQAVLLLAVQFPFTMLAITLGGVLLNQVLAAYASLLAYTLLLANVALLFSVLCARAGTAAGLTALWLLFYTYLPMVLYELAPQTGPPTTWLEQFVLWGKNASVFYRLGEIQATGFADDVIGLQVVSNVVGGLVCFLLAWGLFDVCTRNTNPAGQTRGLLTRRAGAVRWMSTGRAWSWPLIWKDYHFLAGGWPLMVVRLILYATLYPVIVGWNWWIDMQSLSVNDVVGMHAVLTAAGTVIEASILASRIFHDEVQAQTMSSLLTLPHNIGYIAYTKVAGCAMAFVPGLAFLLFDGLVTDGHVNTVADFVTNPYVWACLIVVSIFLHLTVLLSLFVKWGALPLAFLITVMSFNCCPFLLFGVFGMFGRGNDNDSLRALLLGFELVLMLGSSFLFQMMIHARLYEIGTR